MGAVRLNPNGTIPIQYLPTAGDSQRFRDLYMQDWSVQVENDYIEIRDPYSGAVTRQLRRRDPKIKMEWRGKPVTIDQLPSGDYRIAVWTPGEEMRTEPLYQQHFEPSDFYDRCKKAVFDARDRNQIFGPNGLGMEQAFVIEWCENNYRNIRLAEDNRVGYQPSFYRPGETSAQIKTEDFIGEDGNRYVRTVPMTEQEHRRLIQKEALRKQREEARLARIEREQEELEAIPNFGAF